MYYRAIVVLEWRKWHVENQYPTQDCSQKILREKEGWDHLDYYSESIYPFTLLLWA